MPDIVDDRPRGRIIHVHIPRTAGTALALALRRAVADPRRVCPALYEPEISPEDYQNYDLFTGHFGFTLASEIGGSLITILRDPVDRFLSWYFYLRNRYNTGEELSRKASLAARFPLEQFVLIRDEPALEAELHNRMVWQIAHSPMMRKRRDWTERGVTDADLVKAAVANLDSFTIVGSQADMAGVATLVWRKFGVRLSIGHENATAARQPISDVSTKLRSEIEWWVGLDQVLYDSGRRMTCPGNDRVQN